MDRIQSGQPGRNTKTKKNLNSNMDRIQSVQAICQHVRDRI